MLGGSPLDCAISQSPKAKATVMASMAEEKPIGSKIDAGVVAEPFRQQVRARKVGFLVPSVRRTLSVCLLAEQRGGPLPAWIDHVNSTQGHRQARGQGKGWCRGGLSGLPRYPLSSAVVGIAWCAAVATALKMRRVQSAGRCCCTAVTPATKTGNP